MSPGGLPCFSICGYGVFLRAPRDHDLRFYFRPRIRRNESNAMLKMADTKLLVILAKNGILPSNTALWTAQSLASQPPLSSVRDQPAPLHLTTTTVGHCRLPHLYVFCFVGLAAQNAVYCRQYCSIAERLPPWHPTRKTTTSCLGLGYAQQWRIAKLPVYCNAHLFGGPS